MQEWKADFKMTMMMTVFPLTPRKPIWELNQLDILPLDSIK